MTKRTYEIVPRWRYAVYLVVWFIVIFGYIGQQIGKVTSTGAYRASGVLGTITGGALAYVFCTLRPARKGLKWHRGCKDMSAVVVTDNGVTLKRLIPG